MMKYNFIALLAFFLTGSCNGQSKSLAECPIDLESFDFNTKISDLLPEKYKVDEDTYEIPGAYFPYTIGKWPTYDSQSDENAKIVGYHYQMSNYSNVDPFAVFGKQEFEQIGIATNLDSEVKLIAANVKVSEQESNDFIQKLTAHYGNYKILKAKNFGDRDIYEWENKDRIYLYALVRTDNSNAIRMQIDKDGVLTEGGIEYFTESYFYLISKDFLPQTEYLNTGIFRIHPVVKGK